MMAWRSGSSSIAQRPISAIVRLQPRQKPLSRSIVQMPMQGDVTRRTIDDDDNGAAMDKSGLLAEKGELVLQLVELALEVVDHGLALRRYRRSA